MQLGQCILAIFMLITYKIKNKFSAWSSWKVFVLMKYKTQMFSYISRQGYKRFLEQKLTRVYLPSEYPTY